MSGLAPYDGKMRCGVRKTARRGRLFVVGALCAAIVAFAGCESETAREGDTSSGVQPIGAVNTITAEQARALMVSDQDVVLDVRTQEEYDASHIANARLLPVDEMTEKTAAAVAPDKGRPVFVYCRTGIRSAEAAEKLADLGYAEIYDFGGILSWPYDTIDADVGEEEAYVGDRLPVGVKVVCGKTRALPEEGE